MTYFVGLDVSLCSTHICVVDDRGELVVEGKTDAEVADIVDFLDELEVEITEVGLEAGTLTQYLTYGLRFAGYEIRDIFKIFGVKLPSKLGHASSDRALLLPTSVSRPGASSPVKSISMLIYPAAEIAMCGQRSTPRQMFC